VKAYWEEFLEKYAHLAVWISLNKISTPLILNNADTPAKSVRGLKGKNGKLVESLSWILLRATFASNAI
jgi:hypothetical protein